MVHSEQHELALRAHVRDLLLDYSLTHLTTNYVTFTEQTASELLSSLFAIPTKDRHSLALPVDPFEMLSDKLGLREVQAYDQLWSAGPETLQILRKKIALKGTPRSRRVWNEDDKVDCVNRYHYPMSPIQTRNTIRQTPKLGCSDSDRIIFPRGLSACLLSHWIESAPTPDSEEPERVSIDHALDLKLTVDPSTHSAVRGLLKCNALAPQQISDTVGNQSHRILTFLRGDSPSRYRLIHPESPPIFPYNQRVGCGIQNNPCGAQNMAEISKIIGQPHFEEEPELTHEHMVVINGWNAYTEPGSQSSLDTPSLASGSSDVDELDAELWLPSSPRNMPPYVSSVLHAKMDDVLLPQFKRISGAGMRMQIDGDVGTVMEGKSLSAFITPLLPKADPLIATTPPMDDETAADRHSQLSPLPPSSMFGQPPSESDSGSQPGQPPSESDSGSQPGHSADESDSVGKERFEKTLQKIYKPLKGGDHRSIIMEEKLEEKDGMMMEVPVLPPPNLHRLDNSLPRTLCSLVTNLQGLPPAVPSAEEVDRTYLPFQVLQKVTGMKSLNIELTWRPFNFGLKVPTHEDVVEVSALIDIDSLYNENAEEQKRFTSLLTSFDSPTSSSAPHRSYMLDDGNVGVKKIIDSDETTFILTIAERRRVARTQNTVDSSETSSDEVDQGGDPSCSSHSPHKRVRMLSHSSGFFDDSNHLYASGLQMIDIRRKQPDSGCKKNINSRTQLGLDTYWTNDGQNSLFQADSLASYVTLEPEYNFVLDDYQDLYPRALDMVTDADDALQLDQSLPDSHYWPAVSNAEYLLDETQGGGQHSANDTFESPELQPRSCTQKASIGDESMSRLPMRDGFMSQTSSRVVPPVKVAPSSNFILPSHRPSLASFLQIRREKLAPCEVSTQSDIRSSPSFPSHDLSYTDKPSPNMSVPPEIVSDKATLSLSQPWIMPLTWHRYMVSLDLVQKIVLLRCLESPSCAVECVEREHLSGVDVIVDPNSAILFVSLAALPSQCNALSSQLASLSWLFSRLLVVFEAFPTSHLYRTHNGSSEAPYAYGPPVLKAIKRLRRDLGLHEGLGDKNPECFVQFAFANRVDEAALLTRLFGAHILESHHHGVSYDNAWLGDEEQEGEGELATTTGMNAFAASVILSQCTLDDLLEMSPEERKRTFGPVVGNNRIEHFNSEVEYRMESLAIKFPMSPALLSSLSP